MMLPILEFVDNFYKDTDLSNFSLISCQHYLKTNQDMIFALMKKGLKAENIFMISKSYSYNPEIHKKFLERGIFSFNYEYDSYKSFDKQFKSQIKQFVKQIKPKLNKKVLIIDDGGELIKSLNKLHNKDFHAVEQTSSGFNKLRKIKINFPIVNVARSKAKLEIESPFIADLAYKKILGELKKIKIFPEEILIIGNGPIGKEIKILFDKKFRTLIYDIKENKEKIHEIIKEKEKLLIIGCSGKTSLHKKYHKLLKKSILVSVSSSDREFDSVYIRKKVEKNKNPHKNIITKDIILLNSGFPITFDGSLHGTPPNKIQLTQGLMMAGAYQSIKEKKKKLIQLNSGIQEKIIEKFQEIISA